jgi:hypothetical protein
MDALFMSYPLFKTSIYAMLLCLPSRNKQSAYYCPKIASLKQGEIDSYLANTPKKRLTMIDQPPSMEFSLLLGQIQLKPHRQLSFSPRE